MTSSIVPRAPFCALLMLVSLTESIQPDGAGDEAHLRKHRDRSVCVAMRHVPYVMRNFAQDGSARARMAV